MHDLPSRTALLPLPAGARAGVRGRPGDGPAPELASMTLPASHAPSPRRREGVRAALRLAALAASLLLAGCITVGPDYHRPEEAAPALQGVDPARQTAQDFEAEWWRQFGDPTLDTLIRRAARNAPDLKIARARLAEARAVLGATRADLWPTVDADAGYTRSREQQPGFSDRRSTVTAYQAGFDASWEVDLFGGVRRGVEAARADAEAGAASLADAQVTLFAEVARHYFDLRGTQLRIGVAQRDIANQQASLKLIRARAEIGSGSEQDVASANARLAATEAGLPTLQAREQADRFRLAVLLGQRPGELDVDLSPATFRPIDASLPIGNAADVLARRPDVRVAERALAAATARIGVAKADWFPHVSLGGFVGFLAGRSSDFGDAQSRAWSVAPSIRWSGLNVARVRNGVKASEARADAALAGYQRTVLAALEDVDNALVGYNKQRERVQKLAEQATQSRRAADLARVRYEAGATGYLELLDAERTQLAAEDQLAEAEAGVNLQAIALYKALGGGWQACGDEACTRLAGTP
ncbi:multidrug efflux system outer membrane protein [Fulvimonas soli]|uniref:Multidrug efflux system outer membrane protein n=2 Tax=Fulvimonas soli TaxID=155197 RepID=A0A316IIN7_9GAMM|nr:multidrug efflux system outer membrane protein [Fulvimonas soli]